MRAVPSACFTMLLSATAFGQVSTPPPAFEAADVHPSPKSMVQRLSGGVLAGGRLNLHSATIVDLMRIAWTMEADKITGGPSWVEFDRFDVIAQPASPATPENARLMLQALLAERFHLVARPETKPMPAFVLSQGKGKPKIKPADGTGEPGCRPVPRTAPPEPGEVPLTYYTCRSVTMPRFAELIHNYANGYLTSPTFDQTNLAGNWDFDLHWNAVGTLAAAGDNAITLFDAIDKQLSLKLEPKMVPQPVVQIVSVDRTPIPNPPGVTSKLPPPPPATFEVSDVRPTGPGATGGRLALQASGRLDAQGIPLHTYINLAWSVNSQDLLAGVPKFADTARYDIIARAATSPPPPGSPGPAIDPDSMRIMLQNLLKERFKLAVHTENRPVNGYVLISLKPKMAKADPSGRTSCTQPPPGSADPKDPRLAHPTLSRYVVCHNVTMAQFAELLPTVGTPYVQTPVLDSTGLTGSYDFTLSFSPPAATTQVINGQVVQPAGRGGGAADASDPNEALTLPEAVAQQLGLKMELQKRPLPVLVIDHLEEKPTGN